MQFKKIDPSQIYKVSNQVEENFMGKIYKTEIQWIFIIEVFMEFLRHPVLA